NEVGGDRSISSYTKYMCVTDNTYINKVSGAITNADPSQLVSGEYGRNDTSASNLVTWVESHDTYSGKYPVFYEAWHYGIMAARKDSRPMLLAHPDSADDSKTVGIVASYDFESEFFAVTNRFHNRFLGASEAIYAQEQNLIIERYSSTDAGALVINFKKNANVTVSFTNLEDGIYYDQLTGKRVEVKNHQATLQMDKDIALAVLTKTKNQPHPRYSISVRGGAFLTNLNVVVESKYATDAYYTVNGGEHIAIENGYANITLANQTSDVTLAFHFANSQFTIDRTYVYKAVSIKEGGFNIIDLNTSYLTDNELYFWAWSGSTAGKWYKLSEVLYKNDNGTLLVNFPSDKDHFLIGLFAKGYVVTNVNAWDNNCIKQTANIVISDKYFIATGW
nr:hypothetical protein [Gammaproteobacteria bacterium]